MGGNQRISIWDNEGLKGIIEIKACLTSEEAFVTELNKLRKIQKHKEYPKIRAIVLVYNFKESSSAEKDIIKQKERNWLNCILCKNNHRRLSREIVKYLNLPC